MSAWFLHQQTVSFSPGNLQNKEYLLLAIDMNWNSNDQISYFVIVLSCNNKLKAIKFLGWKST